jgi:hypothetical protein
MRSGYSHYLILVPVDASLLSEKIPSSLSSPLRIDQSISHFRSEELTHRSKRFKGIGEVPFHL